MKSNRMPEIYVTGIGAISSIGNNVGETLRSLKAGKSGIGKLSLFESQLYHIPVCEVKLDNRRLASLTQSDPELSRTALLSLAAASEAIRSAGLTSTEDICMASATTAGGVDLNEIFYKDLLTSDRYKNKIRYFDCGDAIAQTARRFNINNIANISTACSSSANAIIYGARMIKNGLAERALAGGTDALTRFALNGFNSLEILSHSGCKPFDADRDGITPGEGAAYLVLESSEVADKNKILCRLSGYSNTTETYHQTASSPQGEGAADSIRQSLLKAGLQPSDVDCINAHGTGTAVNDLSEGRAIQNVFGTNVPPFGSTKGFTGHAFAAAGALEAVISILALKYGVLFPNIGFERRMPELDFDPVRSPKYAALKHVLSDSFGFGGSNSSLIFSSAV